MTSEYESLRLPRVPKSAWRVYPLPCQCRPRLLRPLGSRVIDHLRLALLQRYLTLFACAEVRGVPGVCHGRVSLLLLMDS
jgi:hypothetical protein